MGRKPDERRLERYGEVVPEYPEGIRASQVARVLGRDANLPYAARCATMFLAHKMQTGS